MVKIVDLIKKIGKKENEYKDYSIEELKQKKEELQKQRDICQDTIISMERGYSRGYDGHVVKHNDDVFGAQIRSLDRKINKIEAELRRRKEESSSEAGYEKQ